MGVGVRAAFGPPVDFDNYTPTKGPRAIRDTTLIGLYVEPEHRPAFPEILLLSGLEGFRKLQKTSPEAMREAVRNAKRRIFLPPRE